MRLEELVGDWLEQAQFLVTSSLLNEKCVSQSSFSSVKIFLRVVAGGNKIIE